MDGRVLALNAGSSSLKFAVFEARDRRLEPVARGEAQGLGETARLAVRGADGEAVYERAWPADAGRDEVVQETLKWLRGSNPQVTAIGHRVVHGGPAFAEPLLIDGEVIRRLEALVPWAPLHQPAAISMIRQTAEIWPDAPQIACFDTAFHGGQAAVVRRFALPRHLETDGLRRYGFHGLSCQSVLGRLTEVDPVLAGGRVLVAHLGAGASISAVRAGRSVDTSMGFSPLDGLVMATRCGALDPGVVLFLQQAKAMSAAEVEDMLYRRSGLLGVSGVSSDMRRLLASGETAAREAVELFVFRAVREAGALAASMEGLDGLIFTGGIGENAPAVRRGICERLAWLGLELDSAANEAVGDRRISAPSSRVRAWVLATDEERVIAEACASSAARAPA